MFLDPVANPHPDLHFEFWGMQGWGKHTDGHKIVCEEIIILLLIKINVVNEDLYGSNTHSPIII
jgi:hypothetical protein